MKLTPIRHNSDNNLEIVIKDNGIVLLNGVCDFISELFLIDMIKYNLDESLFNDAIKLVEEFGFTFTDNIDNINYCHWLYNTRFLNRN